jgi:hypothetical protein
MVVDKIEPKGYVKFCMTRLGKTIYEHEQNNLIVTNGKNFFTRRVFETSSELISSVGLGTSSTAPTLEDFQLENQVGIRPIEFPQATGNIIEVVGTFPEGVATGTINEVGLFTNEDTMISRTVLTQPFEKTDQDFLNIIWQIQIA